jgi:hypothetical protein
MFRIFILIAYSLFDVEIILFQLWAANDLVSYPVYQIFGPGREMEKKRFIPLASHPFDLYTLHQRISSKPPHRESPCVDIVLHPSACSHFTPSLLSRPNFPSWYLWPRSHLSLASSFQLHVRVLEDYFPFSLRLHVLQGGASFAHPPPFRSSWRTWDHFIIFMSAKSRMDGRILQIARTDVVRSRK